MIQYNVGIKKFIENYAAYAFTGLKEIQNNVLFTNRRVSEVFLIFMSQIYFMNGAKHVDLAKITL